MQQTVVPDCWGFDGGSPCLDRGGGYYQGLYRGPFYVYYNGASDTRASFGCRVLDKP